MNFILLGDDLHKRKLAQFLIEAQTLAQGILFQWTHTVQCNFLSCGEFSDVAVYGGSSDQQLSGSQRRAGGNAGGGGNHRTRSIISAGNLDPLYAQVFSGLPVRDFLVLII
jgi:hypothetical protein